MTEGNDGAYPELYYNDPDKGSVTETSGFTKLEMGAFPIMQGLCANPEILCHNDIINGRADHALSEYAVKQADSLIAELNK